MPYGIFSYLNFACQIYIWGNMVFIAIFNNISAISWRSALLVKETGVSGENHRPAVSHWQTLSHNVVSSTLLHVRNFIFDVEIIIRKFKAWYRWSTIPPLSKNEQRPFTLHRKSQKTTTYVARNPSSGLGQAYEYDGAKPVNYLSTFPLLMIGSRSSI